MNIQGSKDQYFYSSEHEHTPMSFRDDLSQDEMANYYDSMTSEYRVHFYLQQIPLQKLSALQKMDYIKRRFKQYGELSLIQIIDQDDKFVNFAIGMKYDQDAVNLYQSHKFNLKLSVGFQHYSAFQKTQIAKSRSRSRSRSQSKSQHRNEPAIEPISLAKLIQTTATYYIYKIPSHYKVDVVEKIATQIIGCHWKGQCLVVQASGIVLERLDNQELLIVNEELSYKECAVQIEFQEMTDPCYVYESLQCSIVDIQPTKLAQYFIILFKSVAAVQQIKNRQCLFDKQYKLTFNCQVDINRPALDDTLESRLDSIRLQAINNVIKPQQIIPVPVNFLQDEQIKQHIQRSKEQMDKHQDNSNRPRKHSNGKSNDHYSDEQSRYKRKANTKWSSNNSTNQGSHKNDNYNGNNDRYSRGNQHYKNHQKGY